MTFTEAEVRKALDTVSQRACDMRDWHAAHAVAHIEKALFGYDPDCSDDCPL